MIKSSLSWRRTWIIVAVLIGLFLVSFAVTCVVLYVMRNDASNIKAERIVGSLRIESLQGRSLEWHETLRNISNFPKLKMAIEAALRRCLGTLLPVGLEVTSVDEDNLARIFGVNDHGIIVEWAAKIRQDGEVSEELVAETLMKCKANIELEPESVKVGLADMRSYRSFESLETFLLDGEEEFDLRNIELPSIVTPKFIKGDSSCPPLKEPDFGSISPISCTLADHITLGMVCKFSCQANQTLIGNDEVACLATGSWSYLPPVCSNFCPKLSPILNGRVYPDACLGFEVARPGMRCLFSCNEDYVLEGSSLTCTADGVWKGDTPICKKTCSPLSAPNFGSISPAACTKHRVSLGFVCSFECSQGYTLSGSSSLRCDVNGRWSSSLPTCRKGCPLLLSPSNGGVYPASCTTAVGGRLEVMEGIICVYSCMDGYTLCGAEERICSEGGIWSSDQPECKRVCQPIPLTSNMIVFPHSCQSQNVTEGTKCDLHCIGQYSMFGVTTSRSCLESGFWSDSDATCHRTCPHLPRIPNGAIYPSFCVDEKKLIPETSVCFLECSAGFFLSGRNSVQCSSSGIWLGTLGSCLKKCEKLSLSKSVTVSPAECSLNDMVQGSHCEFSCEEEHTLNGLRVLTCLGDGTWAGSVPTCKPDSHVLIRQKTMKYDVCLTADADTLQVRKISFDECQRSLGLHWWISTPSGQFKSVMLDKCMAAYPSVGFIVKLEDCSEIPNQKWIRMGEDQAQSIALKDWNLYLYYGFSSVPTVSLSVSVDETSLWYVVFSNTSLGLFEDEFGGSCPKLKNLSTIVNPPGCVLNSYIKNGVVCEFSCRPGFKLYGFPNRTCSDGQWNGTYPTCRRACDPLLDPPNGSVSGDCKVDLQDQETICRYECLPQHKLIGQEEVMCLSHGKWSHSIASCISVCQPLSPVPRGTIYPPSCLSDPSKEGMSCSLLCAFPYLVKGTSITSCQNNHLWSGDWSCERGCDTPELKGGTVTCQHTPPYNNSTCTYHCNAPLVFIHIYPPFNGTVSRKCQSDGLFNGSAPHCGMLCDALTKPSNGIIEPVICTAGVASEGVTCTVKCNMGYRFSGYDPILTCTSDGTWSEENVTCEEEHQFVLFNDDHDPSVCVLAEDDEPGSPLKKHDKSDSACFFISGGSVWTWDEDLLKNVRTGLCAAVQDLSTLSSSLVESKECNKEDQAQLWECEHEYFLKIMSKPLYMSSGSESHPFAIVKNFEKAKTKADFVWKSEPSKNIHNIGGACNSKMKSCSLFDDLPHGSISPEECKTSPHYDGMVCNIECDKGYVLKWVYNQSISVRCSAHGAWKSTEVSAIDALPPECLKTCPPLTAPPSSVITPEELCTGENSAYGVGCLFTCGYLQNLEGPDVLACGKDGTWSDSLPRCLTMCMHDTMRRGDHTAAPYTDYPVISGCATSTPAAVGEGDFCHYHCPGGLHKLVGPEKRLCGADTNFDQAAPECVFPTASYVNVSNCPHPPGEPDAIYVCSLVDGQKSTERICANYSCAPTYKLVGEPRIHCDVTDYTWPEPPTCHKLCENIPYICNDIHAGEICYHKCLFGKAFSHGNGILLCQEDGTYNDTVPACIEVQDFFVRTQVLTTAREYCLTPPPDHAPFINEPVTVERCFGEIRARWIWKNNFNIMHIASSLCITASAAKSGARLYLTYCNPLEPMQQFDCSDDLHEPTSLVFRADPTLILGTMQALYNHDSHTYFACLVESAQLSEKNHISTRWTTFISSKRGSVCAVRQNEANCAPLHSMVPRGVTFSPSTCLEEWSPQGRICYSFCDLSQETSAIKCDHGLWNTTTISCKRSCPPLEQPVNGMLKDCDTLEHLKEGTTCNVECGEHSYVVGETVRVCQWDGTWSGNPFKCAKSCPSLNITAELVIEPHSCSNGNRSNSGTVCSYLCDEGYHMNSKETTRTCLDDGTWSGKEPLCVRVCTPLPLVAHGSISPASCSSPLLSAGISCTINCDEGYSVVGSGTIECKNDGTWSNFLDSETVCQSQCPALLVPQNSRMVCSLYSEPLNRSRALFPEPTECRILCDIGYVVLGSWIRRCGKSGSWSGEDAYCHPKDQFFIFLSKENKVSKEVTICLAATPEDAIIKIDAIDCLVQNPLHRWTWHSGTMLRNSGSGKCVAVSQPYAGQPLELFECNHNDTLQQWSCNTDMTEWFLQLRHHDLYPDFGYSSARAIWVYDLNLFDMEENIMWYALPASGQFQVLDDKTLRRTLCSLRGEDAGGICNPLSLPPNGKVYPPVCTSHDFNITAKLSCTYECNIGFKPNVATMSLVCQENGLWSGPPPLCQGFCSPFNRMPHMVIHPPSCYVGEESTKVDDIDESDGILPGGVCVISCEDGYTLDAVDELLITCLESGQWSSKPTECRSLCPSLSPMQNAIAIPESCFMDEQIQDMICALQCNEGYVIDISLEQCDGGPLVNGTEIGNLTVSHDNCTTDTKPISFLKEITKMCTSDRSWSGGDVECVPVCQPAVVPWHGQVLPLLCMEDIIKEGTECVYSCDDGFMVEGDDTLICNKGLWEIPSIILNKDDDEDEKDRKHSFLKSHDPPACKRFCLSFVQNDNYTFVAPNECNAEKIAVGTTCQTSCHSDFIMIGNARTTCSKDGLWDVTPAKCIKKCSALAPIDNGVVIPLACTSSSVGSGAVCTFSCLNDFALIGSVSVTCNATGHWSSVSPRCKRRCNPLARIYNGVATPDLSCYSEYITTGDSCNFICNDGFALEGSETVTCRSDGRWDSPVPKCIRLCETPLVANSTVKCTNNKYTWGTNCRFSCDRRLSPSSQAFVTCDSKGQWSPGLPECVETGVPMYIMQSLDGNNVCLMEDDAGNVVRINKQECLMSSSDAIQAYQWRWLDGFNIQNIASGRCIAVHYVRSNEPLVTARCDTEDSLQWWECSTSNPFRLLLRDTAYSPSTYLKNSKKVVMQLWSDAHSYFSTLSLNTVSFSSLCSRRPGGACPPLYDIPNGVIEPLNECKTTAVEEGQICGYRCVNDSYVLIGEAITMCLGNGLWLHPPPKCAGSCPMLDDTLPPNAYYEDPECVFDEPQTDQVCTASCLPGYELNGNPNRTCLPSGEWTPRLFECHKICPVIFGILDGTVEPGQCRSMVCTFSCNPGFVLDGARVLSCLSGGEWDRRIPLCKRDAQFQLISIGESTENMCVSAKQGRPAFLSECGIDKETQLFKWIQDSSLIQHTGSQLCLTGSVDRWGQVELEFCDEMNPLQVWHCGTVPEEDSLFIKIGGVSHHLDVGAGTVNMKLAMENAYYSSSRWMAKHYFSQGTACSMRDIGQCPPFPTPKHGQISPPECNNHTEITEGLVCSVTCNVGYGLEATPFATCRPDGKWSLPVPVCKGVNTCGKMLSSSDVIMSPNACYKNYITSGETCYFSCRDGFSLVGSSSSLCLDTGIWSGTLPACVQTCPQLLLPDDGFVDPVWCLGNNNLVDTRCTFSCKAGLKMIGQPLWICRGNGLWSGDNVQCINSCPSVSPPVHGTIFPSQCATGDSNEGTICSILCNSGYGLRGAKELLCSNGNWSSDAGSCVLLNACPTVTPFLNCDMDVVYHGLFDGDAIIPGSQVTVSCGPSCKIPTGPSTRSCNQSGHWEYGTPICKKMCPPIKIPYGATFRPISCSYLWQVDGMKCVSSCAKKMSAIGVTNIQCIDGVWSDVIGGCVELRADNYLYSKPFMIRQFYPNETHICLQVSDKNDVVVQSPAKLCSELNLPQLWTWYDDRLIRSVSSGLCWTPLWKEDGIILGLETCRLKDSSQSFTCGSIDSQENKLHLFTEGMQVWHSGSTEIQITSAAVDNGLEWESVVIGTDITNRFTTSKTMSLENPTCRAMCGETTSSHSGTFFSPGHPSSYVPNLICDWEISTPNRKIYLWLHNVDVGSPKSDTDDRCSGDFVMILDGKSVPIEDSNILGRICGKHRNTIGPFISMHETMTIRFISRSLTTKKGFAATWDTEPLPRPRQNCGVRPLGEVSGRLVGGVQTNVSEVPWHGSLISLYGEEHLCGATFIDSLYLITAAHCLSGLRSQHSVSDYAIGYGAPLQQLLLNWVQELILASSGGQKSFVNSTDGATLVRISEFHIHPEFSDGVNNDIALIKISEEAHFGNLVACIPPQLTESELVNLGRLALVKSYCSVVGWDSEKQQGVTALHSIKLPIMSDHLCQEISSESFGREINTTSVICAAHYDGTKQSLCDGDDGSALVCEWNQNYYVVGVASFQLANCAVLNVPKYFVRVAAHTRWIARTMFNGNK